MSIQLSLSSENTRQLALAAVHLSPDASAVFLDASGHYAAVAVFGTSAENAQERANFIVRAANSHDKLLAACVAMSACCGTALAWKGETHRCLLLIEEAIVKANQP